MNNTYQIYPIWNGEPVKELSTITDALWDFDELEVAKLWSYYGTRGQGVNTYIIDSGVDADHLVFRHQKPKAKSFIPGVADFEDRSGHGTWVAGKVGGDGIGIAPKCNLTCLRTLDDSGVGDVQYSVNALKYILEKEENPHIVNMSLGGLSSSRDQERIINELYEKGTIVVAAAGNMNTNTPFFPAAFEKVIAVSALTRQDVKADFSNYGYNIDVSAPGVACYSSYLGDTYREMSGTSMASPIVTGILTLGVSFILGKHKDIQKFRIRELIISALQESAKDIGEKGKDIYYGFGELNGVNFMKTLEKYL